MWLYLTTGYLDSLGDLGLVAMGLLLMVLVGVVIYWLTVGVVYVAESVTRWVRPLVMRWRIQPVVRESAPRLVATQTRPETGRHQTRRVAAPAESLDQVAGYGQTVTLSSNGDSAA
jgi:hypothetical protein